MRKLAFMYDFDETLCNGEAQYFDLFNMLNLDSDTFWAENLDNCMLTNTDVVLGFLYKFMIITKRNNIKLTANFLREAGKNIEFFKGVEEWFDRINKYALDRGFEIEHYIISCGMKNIIQGSKIADKFRCIFANDYIYDNEGVAYWPSQVVNYTTKTQYIFRVKKNLVDNLTDTKRINDKVSEDEILPYANMFYFGDGDTDIPCMKVVKDKGGKSVCVYNPDIEKKRFGAMKILADGRVNAIAQADFSEGSALDLYIKQAIDDLLQ